MRDGITISTFEWHSARAQGRASTFEEAKQALAQAVGLASLDGLESADVEFVVIYYPTADVDDDPECPYAWAIFRNEENEEEETP